MLSVEMANDSLLSHQCPQLRRKFLRNLDDEVAEAGQGESIAFDDIIEDASEAGSLREVDGLGWHFRRG